MLIIPEPNKMRYSVMETLRARGAQLEDWLVSMPGSVECEGRTKSRARTVIGKKILSTLSSNPRPTLYIPQPFRTLSSVSPSSSSSLSTACIEYSALDQLPNDNIGINNRHYILSFSLP